MDAIINVGYVTNNMKRRPQKDNGQRLLSHFERATVRRASPPTAQNLVSTLSLSYREEDTVQYPYCRPYPKNDAFHRQERRPYAVGVLTLSTSQSGTLWEGNTLYSCSLSLANCFFVSLEQIYNARAYADFSWNSDGGGALMSTSQVYQFQKAAAMYFGELLEAEEKTGGLLAGQDALVTTVTATDHRYGLNPSGEKIHSLLPTIVNLQYVGDEEIASLSSILEAITQDHETPSYYNLLGLAGSGQKNSFTITFVEPDTDMSTELYAFDETNVESTARSAGEVGLIIACTLACVALVVALILLLWAFGCFDKSESVVWLTRSWSASTKTSKKPYGYNSKTAPTQDTLASMSGNVGAEPKVSFDEHDAENVHPARQGLSMTPNRGVYRNDDEMMLSAESEATNTSHSTEAVLTAGTLGIRSLRKLDYYSPNSVESTHRLEDVQLSPRPS